MLAILPACWAVLERNGKVKSSDVPCADKRIVDDGDSCVMSLKGMKGKEAAGLFHELIVKTPYNSNLYMISLARLGDSDNTLEKIAEYFHVKGVPDKKRELLSSVFDRQKPNFCTSFESASESVKKFLMAAVKLGFTQKEGREFFRTFMAPLSQEYSAKAFSSLRPSIRESESSAEKAREVFIKWAKFFCKNQEAAARTFRSLILSVRAEDVSLIFGETKQKFFSAASESEAEKIRGEFASRIKIYFDSSEEIQSELYMILGYEKEMTAIFEAHRQEMRSSGVIAQQFHDKFIGFAKIYARSDHDNENFFRELISRVKDEDVKLVFEEIKPKFFTGDNNTTNLARKNFSSRAKIYLVSQEEIEKALGRLIAEEVKRYSDGVFESMRNYVRVSPENAKKAQQLFLSRTKNYYASQEESAKVLRSYIDGIKDSELTVIFDSVKPKFSCPGYVENPEKKSDGTQESVYEALKRWQQTIKEAKQEFISRAAFFCTRNGEAAATLKLFLVGQWKPKSKQTDTKIDKPDTKTDKQETGLHETLKKLADDIASGDPAKSKAAHESFLDTIKAFDSETRTKLETALNGMTKDLASGNKTKAEASRFVLDSLIVAATKHKSVSSKSVSSKSANNESTSINIRKTELRKLFSKLANDLASGDQEKSKTAHDAFMETAGIFDCSENESAEMLNAFMREYGDEAGSRKGIGTFLGLAAGGLALAGLAVPAAIAGGIGGIAYLFGKKRDSETEKMKTNVKGHQKGK